MRIIYLGTPEFAVPTLQKLLSWPHAEVVAVVTQPDRPAGRGNHIYAPPTKLVAEANRIPVLQPEKLSRSPEVVQAMRDLKADIMVMVAFGQILKKEVLTMAPMGVMNLHGSLLPKYRGAAPINWAIINGETVTGNTTMFSDSGVDTGTMLLKQEVPITPDMTAEELAHTMAVTGADLVMETLDQLRLGTITPIVQDDSQATFAPRLSKETGLIDFRKSAQQVHDLVRGLVPWPGAYTTISGATLKVSATRILVGEAPQSESTPGTLIVDGGKVAVTCGENGEELIELLEVQPPNKSKMKARDWVNGARLKSGIELATV